MDRVVFTSPALRIVCISDTHNDDCQEHIPQGDILIHAGDLTDDGTFEELRSAFEWISTLTHKVKVIIAGNHDLGLDCSHPKYSPEAVELFTSAKAKECGVHYLDREVQTIAWAEQPSHDDVNGSRRVPIRIYGNPCQPDFLKSSYAFTYSPPPSRGAEEAWATAPSRSDNVDIWAMHSPPKGRLDYIPLPPLTGCTVQARKIAEGRPLLCVFGHYHYSWGVERVRWRQGQNEADKALKLPFNENQLFDFTEEAVGGGWENAMKRGPGNETIFVNASWMTMDKGKVERRNPPFVIVLPLPR